MCAADHGRARHYADGQPVCDRIRKTATSVPRDRSRITKHNSHKAKTRTASLIALNSSIMVPGVRYARSRRAPRFRCQKCISRCELCFKRTVLLFTWTMRCHTGTLLRRLRSYEPALGIIWTNNCYLHHRTDRFTIHSLKVLTAYWISISHLKSARNNTNIIFCASCHLLKPKTMFTLAFDIIVKLRN